MTGAGTAAPAVDSVDEGVLPRPTSAAEDQSAPYGDGEVIDTASDAGRWPWQRRRRGQSWRRTIAFVGLPTLVLLVAVAAAFLKWEAGRYQQIARNELESVDAARNTAVLMLSYHPETVERDLGVALDRMTGKFRESYLQLTRDVVIPGAKQRHVSTEATVKAAAPVSVEPDHAVVLLFIDQNVAVGKDAPTASESTVRVTLDKVDKRWLVSAFDPV